MNIATYQCFNCFHEFDRSYDNRPELTVSCEKCGSSVKWRSVVYSVKPVQKFADCSVDSMHEGHPRFSDSMGINPDQEPEVRKRFPKLDLTFDAEGRLLVKNRKHKLELAKAFGMAEYDGSSWRDFPQSHVRVRKQKSG